MSIRGYIYTKEKEMPASEAGIKRYWRSEKQNQKLVPVLIRLKFDEFRRNSTNFRRYVVVDQTS